MSRIESLGKLLPIGTVFIILCGAIKLVLFYRVFDISIADFLEIGEYATLFVDDILDYLAIFGVGLLMALFLSSKNRSTSETQDLIHSKSKKEKIWTISIALIAIIATTIVVLNVESYTAKLNVIKSGIFVLMCLFYIFAINTNFKFSYISFIASVIIFHSAIDGIIDGHKIIENEVSLNYEIILDGQKIKTDDNLQYIGKSEKYLFLYNIDNKKSTIIPMDKVSEIQIKPKKKR